MFALDVNEALQICPVNVIVKETVPCMPILCLSTGYSTISPDKNVLKSLDYFNDNFFLLSNSKVFLIL